LRDLAIFSKSYLIDNERQQSQMASLLDRAGKPALMLGTRTRLTARSDATMLIQVAF
jgi:hypothetical protein